MWQYQEGVACLEHKGEYQNHHSCLLPCIQNILRILTVTMIRTVIFVPFRIVIVFVPCITIVHFIPFVPTIISLKLFDIFIHLQSFFYNISYIFVIYIFKFYSSRYCFLHSCFDMMMIILKAVQENSGIFSIPPARIDSFKHPPLQR